MSSVHVEVRPGAYADSVALLGVSRVLQDVPGVAAGQVAMATDLNLDVLTTMGFEVPPGTGPNDLVVAVRLAPDAGEDALDRALAAVEEALRAPARRTADTAEEPPRTTASALRLDPGALVLVSVPGESAFVEAVDALEAGSDVMVFSDNVPVEQEVALKRLAAGHGLLVMGPDCGTAVVGGVGLGFANAVAPGPVGIVAASGTGCQQLLALLDHAGVGVSHALGVGGRDLSAEVGGLATREALRRLDSDPATEVVVLVSKPPDDEVAAALASYVAELPTPVGSGLLGPGRRDLTSVAEAVLQQLGRPVPTWPVRGRAATGRGGRLHGLFVGGTLCTEARLVTESLGAEGSFTDFGDDQYTRGRAHPMIDPTLRLERLAEVGADATTGAVLLDVVLGHGAEPDPAARLAPAIRALRCPVVVALVGTSRDPQGRDRQAAALVEAGAEVHLSNARAARRAVQLCGGAA